MAIVLQCPYCQTNVYPQEEWLGKKARCRKCKKSFILELPKQTNSANAIQVISPEIQSISSDRIHVETADESPPVSADEILGAIQSRIVPVPSTLVYKLSLLAVSFVMLLLPLIYIGLVIGLAAGAVAYGYYGLAIFELNSGKSRRGGAGLVIAYLGPLVAAAVAVVFMFKPFFAGASQSNKPRSLDRKSEPLLFAFIDKLCHAVHAPVPKRIDIDSEVNASASFRNGFLSLLQPNDLVLTIGMPLVSGLSVRELGGVLAHEFGHFSQGMGMRLNYIVRSINHWFARVVYERDEWDEWLANAAKGLDGRISWVFYFAMLMVWLTRRILWVFMMIGHALSCLLMRQMEYDADLHEIRFAGSSAFQSTSAKLRRLGFAYQQSIEEIQNFFVDGKLVNNVPRLVQMNRDGLSKSQQTEIDKSLEEEKSGWFDTHPIDKDRVAVALKVADKGVFRLERPAQVLFQNFEARCKQVSKDFFQGIFEDEFHDNMLVDVEHLLSFKESSLEATQACKRFFGLHFLVPRMISFASPSNRGIAEQSSAEQLKKMRQIMIDRLATYDSQSKIFDDADTKWLICHQALAVHRMELKLSASDWPDIPVKTPQATADAADHYRKTLASLHDHLTQFEAAFSQRVDAAVQWLCAKSRNTDQATRVLRSMSVLQQNYPQMVALRNDMAAISTLIHFAQSTEFNKTQAAAFESYVARIKQTIIGLIQQFIGTSYPFEHAKGQIDLATYFVPKTLATEDIGEVLVATEQMLSNYHSLYFRSIGALASIVQNVESQLGLPAQVDPIEDSGSPNTVTEPKPLNDLPAVALPTDEYIAISPSAYSDVPPTAIAQVPPLAMRSTSSGWSTKFILLLAAAIAVPAILLFGFLAILLILVLSNNTPIERGSSSRPNNQIASTPRPPSFSRPNTPPNPSPPNPTLPNSSRPNTSLPGPPISGRPNNFPTGPSNFPTGPSNFPTGPNNFPVGGEAVLNRTPGPTSNNQAQLPKVEFQSLSALPSLEKTIADLKEAGLTSKAWLPMSLLLSLEVVDEKRSEVLAILTEHLRADNPRQTPNAWSVFCRWADSSCEKELISSLVPHGKLNPPDARAGIETLGRIGNPDHIEIFVGYLSDHWCEDSAKEALSRFGLKAETPVLKRLSESKEMREQRSIVQLLAKCGGAKSIAPLEQFARSDNVFLARDAQSALKEIRKRETTSAP